MNKRIAITLAQILSFDGTLLALVVHSCLFQLLPEELLGVGPDWGGIAVGQLQEGWEEIFGELLRGFAGELEESVGILAL